MEKIQYDYLIVGAGLYGAICARELTDKGFKCLVIEKRNHIGGNLYCENLENITVHKYGAHIFHTSNKKVWNYINSFCEMNNFINSPLAKYEDKLYSLPFSMYTFKDMWGVKTPDEAKAIINKQIEKEGITDPKNLEEKALSLVGRDIYEKLIKGYTEKQWGCKATELPAFIISRLPLRFYFNNNYFNDIYQGIPIGGYNVIFDKLLKDIEVRLECDFIENRQDFENLADKIIFTGQIDSFYEYKFGNLEYRSLKFETEVLDCENYQGNAVINYNEGQIPFTRKIEHKFFDLSNNQSDKTVLTTEYPQKWDKSKESYYPINNAKNNELYEKYKNIKNDKVYFGGRLGQYKYFDMDKTIESALDFIENL